MNAALSEAIKEAFAVAPANVIVYHTLEIRQTGVQGTIYLVQAPVPLTATDENDNEITFEPSGFQFSLPPSTHDGFQNLNLAIDNTNQRALNFVKTAQTQKVPVEILYRPFLSTDLSAPQMVPPLLLYLTDVSVVSQTISGTCTFMDIVNKKFPSDYYTRSRFPTLQ